MSDAVEQLSRKANRHCLNFSRDKYLRKRSTAIIRKKDVSVEVKKQKLMARLQKGVIATFSTASLDPECYRAFKEHVSGLRAIVNKLRDINYYLLTTFQYDARLRKRTGKVEEKGFRELVREQKDTLTAIDRKRLEFITYRLIDKIIFFDKALLKGFRKRFSQAMSSELDEANSLKQLLEKQSDLLRHMEAKLPPAKAISRKLLKSGTYTHWAARIFSLMAAIEQLYSKETKIFKELMNNHAVRGCLALSISQLQKEKQGLMKLQHSRVKSVDAARKMESKLHEAMHDLIAVSRI